MTVRGGVIQTLSVSQVEKFDPAQTDGCPRRWWFEDVQGFRPERSEALSDGDKGHHLLADYLRTGQPPEGRVKMGTAVRAAIAAGNLPQPGPDLLVEQRFSGQPQRDAAGNWIPVDVKKTLWLGGLPWDGFIDLRYRRALATVLDHKFSADIHKYAKPAERLILTVQMPVYCLDTLRLWPDAKHFELVHHYIARTGQESFVRRQVVTLDQVLERKGQIETLVERMKLTARAERQNEVEFNRRSCDAYSGCSHQSRCRAFKEKQVMLSDAEKAFFGMDDVALPTDTNVVRATTQTKPPEAVQYPKPPEVVMIEVAPGESDEDAIARSQGLTPPTASAPAPQPPPSEKPTCNACGTALSRENGSQLRDGTWKHIGCPAESPEGVAKRRGRPPGSKNAPKVDQPERDRGTDETLYQAEGKAVSVESSRAKPTADAVRPQTPAIATQTVNCGPTEAVKLGSITVLTDAPPEPTGPMRAPTPEETASLRTGVPLAFTLNVVVELGPTTTALLGKLLTR